MARGLLSRLPIRELAAAAICTALAAGLVLYDLGSRSLWIDEATTWGVARQHGTVLWGALLQDGGNMFGYYAATHFLVDLFGGGAAVLRLPVALSFVATVPCSYLLVRRLFDRGAAALATLLVVASEPLVYWGQQARGYLPAVFFVVASALALTVAVQDRRRAAWVWFVFLATLACYMILLAGLVVCAELLALALVPRRDLEQRRVLAAVGAIALLCLPLALMAVRRGNKSIDWILPPTAGNDKYLVHFALSSPSSSLVALASLAATLVGAAILVVRLVRHGRSLEAFAPGLLVVWVVFPVLVMVLVTWLAQPLLGDRYLLPVVPALSMLAGVGLSRLRPAPLGWALCLALAAGRLVEVPPTYGVPIETWSEGTSYVIDHVGPHDCIAFFVADGYTAFDYYLLADHSPHRAVPEPVLPDVTWASSTPLVLDPATIPPSRFPAVAGRCPGLIVVYTHQAGRRPGPGIPSYQVRKLDAYDVLQEELAGAHYVRQSLVRFKGLDVAFLTRRSP